MQNTGSNAGAGQAPPRQYPVIDAMCLRLKECLRSLELPPEVRQHFRNARIEVLKGVREMIDQRIDRLSRTGQHGTNIAVE
ncbi:MAG TPA: hypothetical protein VFA28_04030 [Bryobacteraceae bacterium]|jgi:hypothetical protein|nr:hypothetical protein [Bryobacteraceae bacterium]